MNLFPPIEVAKYFGLDKQKVYQWSKKPSDHHYRKTYVIYERLMAKELNDKANKMSEVQK